MKHSGLNLPAHCTMIEENELPEIYGGGSILSFIQYLLSGFTINFPGVHNTNSNDTPPPTARPGWAGGGTPTPPRLNPSLPCVNVGWDPSFTLGCSFNALLRLFS